MAVKKLKLAAALLYIVSFCLLNSGFAIATTRPYFKAYGADVASGGWFNNGSSSCDPSDTTTYQAPNYSGSTNLYSGGIMGFAQVKVSPQGGPRGGLGINPGPGPGPGPGPSPSGYVAGASSEFGALSLGLIEGGVSSNGEPYGFGTANSKNDLSFANKSSLNASSYWGGFLEGTVRQTHCIPDYYGTLQSSPTSIASAPTVNTLNSGQFSINTKGAVTAMATSGKIAAGKKITIFVKGDVHITSDIKYDAHTEANVPKFALVVLGNIYVAAGVNELDGLYIAQPDPADANPVNDDTGNIWTCHDPTTNIPSEDYVSKTCRNQLLVNGAFIAKEVDLVRANGDQASAPLGGEPASSGNIAEVFNYTPEMVVGGGFFNSNNGGSGKIESLISLPPVF